MDRRLHISEFSGIALLARFRSGWSRLTAERTDWPMMTLLLSSAEAHALRAEKEIVGLACAWETCDPRLVGQRATSLMAQTDEILHDIDRLRSLREMGSRSQAESSAIVRPILHALAGQLNSVAREATAGGTAVLSPEVGDFLHYSAAFAARTATLIRSVLDWSREKSRLTSARCLRSSRQRHPSTRSTAESHWAESG